jgi:PAS domain S-box-containing protein
MNPSDEQSQMRAAAEAQLVATPAEAPARPVADLLHELQVHQIELEMQNEALRQAQSALEASRDRYVDLYDFAPVGYLTLDSNGVVVEANLRAVTMLGMERKKLLQRRFSSQLVPEDQSRWQVLFLSLMKQDDKSGVELKDSVELAFKRRDGTVFQAQLDCQGTKSGADGTAIRIAFTDITERKQAHARHVQIESQLRESQKMDALGTLAGGVAHDLNNTLAIVLGNVALARQDVGPGHPALESLEEIGKASRRSKDLVQQILAFGRRQQLERKPTSLSMVVLESARFLRASIPAKVSLTVECKADAPAVLADATQVNQILLNLCGNAFQAVQNQERPGIIEVRVEACAVDEAHGDLRPGRYARLTVSDNGSGIDELTRSRIFEPFFTTKKVGKGTGLGLSVVYSIVQAHDAHIEVESTPGQGSTFYIYFPEINVQILPEVVPARSAAPVGGNGRHVLFVDDEQGLVRMMKRLLESQDFRFSGFDDPLMALEAVRANPDQFDLVVTDHNMPHLSGLELAKAVKEIRTDLPVILASGYITEELRSEAVAAGICELIYKPNTVDVLCEAVARIANARITGH